MTLVPAFVFAAVVLFSYAVLSLLYGEDRVVAKRLQGMTRYEMDQALEAEPVLKSFQERVLRPLGKSVSSRLRRIWPKEYWANLSRKVVIAGRPAGMGVEAFFAVKLGFALLAPSLMAIMLVLSPISGGLKLLFVMLAAVFGYILPNLWLASVTTGRQSRVLRELPDMLDMLTISVEAGLGFDAALAKYVKNSTGALAQEFGRALQEIQAGSSRKEALKRLSERVEVKELSSFISSLVQADVLGTSVANVLRIQAGEMRLTRRQRAEAQAQKLPVKMVFPVILFILPATMIVVLGPAVIALMRLFAGVS